MEAITHPMTYLVNKIFETNDFPRIWKLYKSIGLYKGKEDRENSSSYRPISLLSPLSKIVEKAILIQFYTHMAENGLFNDRSYAYKDNHSTINALLDMSETWCENIDQNTQNVNMFLDMSAAFDCVSHTTLRENEVVQIWTQIY